MQLITSLNLRNSEYLSRDRFISYHHQLRLILNLGKQIKDILEIGIFNSIMTDLLRNKGYKVTTADIDSNLEPDILLDLTSDFYIEKDRYDAIVLFQVLEHLPYEQSEQALKKLAEATKKYLIVSLPYNSEFFAIQVKFSFTKRSRYLLINLPKFWSNKPKTDEHFWEIGLKGYPKKRIHKSVAKAGLTIKQEFTDPIHPYHYFLVLEKIVSK
ncbi:class I SAM-dependent methyltransferase [Nostoc sp. MS1]|uniref:class I SAM-dependent methyltransferase n=1 Tax=Nostoc sp. MS1 TaxID=2764711 RepID=UPI001CC567DB|nr:methyltransferase domain-containing protein [Nostoc sp. MS1]